MSLEVIKQIKIAEDDAQSSVVAANAEAKRIMASSRSDAEPAIKEIKDQYETQIRQINDNAVMKSGTIIRSKSAESLKECEALKADARKRVNTAVDKCMERICNSWR